MRIPLALALLFALGCSRSPSTTAGGPATTSPAMSVVDARLRIEILAADSMEGRDTGRPGGVRAANYIAGELRRMGVTPAGDGGTFFQAIPWVVRTPDTAAAITYGAGGRLAWRRDYILLPRLGFALALGGQPFGGNFAGTNVPSIYGGRIGETLISPEMARGKAVFFAPPAGAQNLLFWQRDNLRRYADASLIAVANLGFGAPATWLTPRETYWDASGGGARPMTVAAVTTDVVSRVFGRPLDSLRVGDSGAALSGNARFLDAPAQAPASNVVGIIPGSDPRLRNTYVAIGAHYDHVGMGRVVDHDSIRAFNSVVRPNGADDPPPQQVSAEQWRVITQRLDSIRRARGVASRPDSIFNGADDDASGTVLMLELAEAIAAGPRPRRSILLVFHTAEEKGLFGSLYYSHHPTVPRDSIVAQINMDQMGRGDPVDNPTGGPNALVVIGSRRLSTELGDIVEQVNRSPAYQFRLDYAYDRDGDPVNAYCRSDHYMYARYGIPVAFFAAAAAYIDYHMVSDEVQYIAYDRMTRIGNYVKDLAVAVANLDHRPVVDKPKPDPLGLCRQ